MVKDCAWQTEAGWDPGIQKHNTIILVFNCDAQCHSMYTNGVSMHIPVGGIVVC